MEKFNIAKSIINSVGDNEPLSLRNQEGVHFPRMLENGQFKTQSHDFGNSILGLRGPINNGGWDGEKGESTWQPDSDYVPQLGNKDGKTWGEILDKYNIDGIPFVEGYPVFDEVCVGEVEVEDFTENRDDNYAQADQALADKWTAENKDGKTWTAEEVKSYRKENNLTWHEKEDMKTMQLIPTEVHNNIPHSGGIAAKKDENQMS